MTGEEALVARLQQALGTAGLTGGSVALGIGDDAAVLVPPAGSLRLVVTVDMLVEGQHFRLGPGGFSPEDVGWKALAVNLSDVAAMGASPLWALCSLGVPDGTPDDLLERVYRGMGDLARRHQVRLVGGNLARSPGGLVLDVTVIGQTYRPITRRGARRGDRIFVTGFLGAAAAGLEVLTRGLDLDASGAALLLSAQCRPSPRLAEAQAIAALAPGMVHAMCDVSDGLVADLRHLLGGLGAVLWEQELPIPSAAFRAADHLPGADPIAWALGGGEDYELLIVAPPEAEEAILEVLRQGAGARCIGEVTPGLVCLAPRPGGHAVPLGEMGWDPFRQR